MQKELDTLWQEIIGRAAPRLPDKTAELWFGTCTPVGIEDGTLVVEVANVFAREQLASKFLDELNRGAAETGKVTSVHLRAIESGDDESHSEQAARAKEAAKVQPQGFKNGLNPNYEFNSFVVGKSNRLAHAASLAVAETPGQAYNPLLIWGGVGLGKTHLMHAICHYAIEKRGSLKAVYISSEKFVNEFIQSIQKGKMTEFRDRYRTVDVLLIDDIQFMAGKDSSQEEFFHTFNSLRDTNKQIVICSDRPPVELHDIEARLRSRLSFGLVTDIQPPDFETRIAILQKKTALRGADIPGEVITFLAQRIPSNIRELEGALNRVIACSELSGDPINIENTSGWLKDILRTDLKAPTSVSAIQNTVAETFEIGVEELTSSKRTAEITQARHIAMYLCRELTDMSLIDVAKAFQRKDHTTVIHAYRKIGQDLKNDDRIRDIVENIRGKL
ncbi:MAG: chromosomal replication initiator protein DnaA [Synergistaceae bacterium]|nr:chromosomal replication initiator protein DnaA [Synergistaceae bacterium]